MKKYPTTLQGLQKLEYERNKLKNEARPNIIKAISSARELGDLSENAEYHAAREQQAFIEAKIKDLNDLISRAEIIDPKKIISDKIMFGATVKLNDIDQDIEKTYQIVGEHEADLDKGLISYVSPLGKELIGKNKGDIIEVKFGGNIRFWEVMDILYQ